MNPNASNFSFSAGAGSFVPGQVRQQYSQQQAHEQSAPDSWDDESYGQPAQQPVGNYGQPAQQGGYSGYYGQYAQQQPQQGYYAQQPGYGQYGGMPQQQQQYSQYQQPYQQGQQQQPYASGSSQQQFYQRPEQPQPQAQIKPRPSAGAQADAIDEKPKVLSIGSTAKPAAAANAAASAGESSEAKTITLGSKPDKAASKPVALSNDTPAPKKETEPAKKAEAPPATAAPKAAAAASSSGTSTPSTSTAARSQNSTLTVGAPAAKVERSADAIAEQVAAVADEEMLKDLYGEGGDLQGIKEHLNIVFIGHVDAGKSTMAGQVLVQCGMVDKRTLEKLEKESKDAGTPSWYLSWALDSTAQERQQGKTVEVGRAYFVTDKRRYTILDAPGHKSFVPAMISGAAQADVAILVISARKGEFETGFEKGGQTREHIQLVKTAGIQKLVVAINKMDEPTVEWAKERYDEIVTKLTPFLRASGFNPKTDVTFVPVSGYTAINIKGKVDKKACPWYDGPSLLELLDDMPIADRKVNAPLMMPISEKYKDMGTIVVGKIESGRARRGDTVMMMPNKVQVEIQAITSENEEEVQLAISGDNVRLRLRGVEDEDISVGFVITDAKQPVRAVQTFEAELAILDHKNIITAGYSAVMHVHTASEEVTLSALLHYFDKKTGRKSRRPPPFAKKGQKIVALIEAAGAVCVERFKDYPQLGRFTLRDEGKTIAIGKVTKLIEKSEDMPNMAALSVGGSSSAPAANGA